MRINVRLERIVENPWQTRVGEPEAEGVKELAFDIAQHGLLQVPVGRLWNGGWVVPGEQFEAYLWELKLDQENNLVVQLAFGHNRLAAFKWLADIKDNSDITGDYSMMPVEIRDLTDEEMAELAWSENEKRVGVTAMERAKAIENWMVDFGWTQAQVGEKLGLARATVSNILRLGKLPLKIQVPLGKGEISERAAMALLPMYELPEDVLIKADENWYCNPKTIERDALNGASSDKLRKDVEHLRESYTVKLQGARFGLDEDFPEGIVGGYDAAGVKIYCGVCRTCDRRLKDTGNVCLDVECFKGKSLIWERRYLEKASAACGIQVVDPTKGGSVTFLPYTNKDAKTIIGLRCENLRLVFSVTADKNEVDVRHVEGHPHAMIICDKRNGSCTCIKGMDIAARKAEPSKAVDQAIQAEKELDPEYEGEEIDPEYEGEEIDYEGELSVVGVNVCAQNEPVPVPASPSPKELEELARQARLAKRNIGGQIRLATEKVKGVLFEGFAKHQPGAYYLVARHYPYPNIRDLNFDDIYHSLVDRVYDLVVPSDADDVDQLYEIINRKLTALGLEPVYPGQTLMETLGGEDEG